MYECQNCEREFEEPEIIQNEKVCPICYSGDIIEDNIILTQSDELERLRCVIRKLKELIKDKNVMIGKKENGIVYSYKEELLNMIGDE